MLSVAPSQKPLSIPGKAHEVTESFMELDLVLWRSGSGGQGGAQDCVTVTSNEVILVIDFEPLYGKSSCPKQTSPMWGC